MTTTVLKININDMTPQFFQDLKEKFDKTAQVEIRVDEQKRGYIFDCKMLLLLNTAKQVKL